MGDNSLLIFFPHAEIKTYFRDLDKSNHNFYLDQIARKHLKFKFLLSEICFFSAR